jgi:hypothetical protein
MWYKKTLVSVFSLWVLVGYASQDSSSIPKEKPEVKNESVSVSTENQQPSSGTIQNNNSRTGSPTNNVPTTSNNNPVVLPVVSEVSIPVNSINSPEPKTVFDLDQKVIDFCGPKINAGVQKIGVLVESMPWGLGWVKDACSIESEFLDYCLAIVVLFAYVNQSKNTNLYAVLFGIRYVYKNSIRAQDRNKKDLEIKGLSKELQNKSKEVIDKLLEVNKKLIQMNEDKEKQLNSLRENIDNNKKNLEVIISEMNIIRNNVKSDTEKSKQNKKEADINMESSKI